MPDLVLSEIEQQALRHLLDTSPCPGSPLPSRQVLEWLSVLIPSDGVIAVFQDGTLRISDVVTLGYPDADGDDRPHGAPYYLGVMHWSRNPLAAEACHAIDGLADGLAIGFRNGPDAIVQVAFGREHRYFDEHDLAMARMLTPLLGRLVRERPTPTLPASLTVQERRVLSHVASGASNSAIAEDLFISPATVRKHLENIYRKLGVSGRLAAVARLQGRDLPDLDLRERIERLG
ncbi:DNA-binding CsgD family transcriptional regulator [Nocardioides sp. BE266]|uniref:helix-turn-helix transcriptional regulator n=1 Tax=Nocardioides sp. BE266 TaxID=2817725 RepID=UPI0028554AA0|nr:helix-turn-helix transcriptional regulator [Nocardioides sp. BE266]MDR7253404.1 DNA-binding CsgD family transcriptional regulator [Nocardioides sp. BE266]